MSAPWGDRPAQRVPARKIHPPDPPAPHVHRERLGARLATDTVGSRPVTLVSAPTGYGKSTFLASWASCASTRVAWLTLDELDDDPLTLWRGVLASIEVTGERDRTRGGVADDLWHPGATGASTMVDDLITHIEDDPEPLVLVLDNIDEIRSSAARATLDRLLRYLPPQLRVVLSGRFDPPLALHRLRTSGQLLEFRAEDLQLSPRDVGALAELSGVPLTDADQHELHRVTGGWPVAVRMVLVAARDAPVAPALRRLLSPRSPVADLLVTDLLASLEPELARFVLRATTCRQIDAVLADTLEGSASGSLLLSSCVERGLFLEREPGQERGPTVYRWHDFFRAQCQARLASTDPSTWRALHRTAAHHWRYRDLEETVVHALAGGRPTLAAQAIGDRWIELVVRGQHALLRALCLKIPPPLDEDPDLLLLVAVCQYLEGDLAQADLQARRARARALAAPQPGDGGRFALLEPLLSLVLAVETPDLSEMARLASELLSSAPNPRGDTATAGAELVVGQLLVRADQTAAGAALLDASATIATSRRMTGLRLACEAELALVASTRDGAGAGRDRARRVLGEAHDLGWGTTRALSPAVLALARSEYERDVLDEARVLASRASALAHPSDHHVAACSVALLLEVALAAGDPTGAEGIHGSLLERDGRHLPQTWRVVVAVLDARWAAALGSTSDARRALAGVVDDALLLQHPSSLVWCAELLRLDGDHEHARTVLELLPPSCRTTHVLVAHRVVRALLDGAADETDQAHRSLEEALGLAELDDVRRPFADRAHEMVPMLRAHLEQGTSHAAWCVTLLTHLADSRPQAPRTPSYWSLTPREHEVLRYLRSAMTAADIASTVFVSVNTVKTHQRAIYRKLGVVGRREAVRVAAERGLL